MPNIYKINVSPKPLTNLTAVLTFTDDSTSTRTDWIEADTYYTITETTIKTLRSLTVSANNYITQTLETSDLDIDITLSPNIKYVSKIKNNGVVYTLKDESVDGKIEGLANKTLSNVSSIDNNSAVATALNGKQATLVSGTNIKTINNNSLLGSGNITIDSLPSQSGQSGKFLTTNGTTASWSTVSIPTVDQIFDSTSTNAQSGVAIGNELVNYVNGRNGNIEINNDGTLADITYSYIDDNTLKEQYSVQVGATMVGHGALIGAMDYTDSQNLKEFGVAVVPEGFGISDGSQNVLLNISNNNLAVNGTEVALTTDIPDISTKQDTLVSGTNIKTVNNTSLLGSGNLSVGTVTSVNNTAPVNGNVTISIPTVNNATLTIQKNGTTVNTFTANSSSDVTANITVPTDTSDLTNNAGFITNSALSGYVQSTDLATVATSGSYNDLSNKPTIPNAQIQSDWNQTNSSAVDFIKNKPHIPSGVVVDQVYDGTSTNAQSGVAMAGELANYVQLSDIDSTLSTTSENPVQNKIITNELNTKQNLLSSDNAGTGITILPEVTEWRVVVPDFPSPDSDGWIGMAYDGTKILMLSSTGYITTSTDGINWSTPTQNSTLVLSGSGWYDVIYDDTKFVAISVIYSGHIYVSTSVDGETWTTPAQKSITINSYHPYPRIAYDGTKYLIITPDGYVSTSEDGDTWTDGVDTGIRTGVDAGDFETLIYAKGKYVTVSNRGYVAVSTDGTTWNRVAFTGNPNGTNAWDELIFNGKEYILLGHYGGISISEDAIEWNFISPQSPRIQIGCNFATYINNKYVIFGYGSSRTYKFAVADQAIISSIVDQTFDSSSINAQSGVAIAGELTNYLQASNGNITFTNGGTTGGVAYADSSTGEMYGTFIGQTQWGDGVMMGAVNPNGYLLGVAPSGINIIKGTVTSATNGIALTVTNNNALAINGTEVALSTDIPSKISDLTDDTATNPVDKADTLTGLTATVTELNYTDGVTSNIQTQFNTITGKIPSQASTSNQLADKAFVNSTVQTNTANFRGNWDTWTLVPTSASSYPADYAGSTTPTVNDYLVVQDASDYTGDTLEGTWRFKYTGTWSTDGKSGWNPEYQVNETPLTSAQLAALNSGITSSDVTLIGTALQPSDITNMVTTDTDQNITGTKTFVGQKKIGFKQSSSSDKLGFTLYNNSGTEKGYLEYNPSNTVDSVPLMTLGNYATASGGLTHVGFRKYSSISGANGAYNLLAPLISDAKTPFNLTTTYTNFYLPLGFTDGTTTVKTAKTGLVDLSSILPAAQIQSDWNQTDTTAKDYIKNKPYIPSGVVIDQTYDGTSTNAQSGVGIQSELSTNYQSKLVSGTNIKSINNTSLLGSGNIGVLQNTATHNPTNSLCIYGTLVSGMGTFEYGTAVGYGTRAGVYSNAFGKSARATGSWAEAFGGNCDASGNWSVVVGHNNEASGNYSTALGSNAKATATRAIQLGEGTNSTASSLQIGFGTNNNYTLLDGTTGLIPDARISSNIARTSQITTPTYDSTNERITW